MLLVRRRAQRVITLLGRDSQNFFRLNGLSVMNVLSTSFYVSPLWRLGVCLASGKGTSPF